MKFDAYRVDGKAGAYITIRPDRHTPGHGFIQAPQFCSMSPTEMIRMANYLADLIEANQDAA